MGLQYLDMMKALGEGASTKWIIPMDLASVAGGITETLAGLGRDRGSNGSSASGGGGTS